jgi:hypothetical protein
MHSVGRHCWDIRVFRHGYKVLSWSSGNHKLWNPPAASLIHVQKTRFQKSVANSMTQPLQILTAISFDAFKQSFHRA